MQEDFIPIPNSDIVLREEFDDWAVLFNPDTAAAFGINPVGVMAWKLIDGKRSLHNIIQNLRENLLDVPETVDQEIADFIKELTDRGFLGREYHSP